MVPCHSPVPQSPLPQLQLTKWRLPRLSRLFSGDTLALTASQCVTNYQTFLFSCLLPSTSDLCCGNRVAPTPGSQHLSQVPVATEEQGQVVCGDYPETSLSIRAEKNCAEQGEAGHKSGGL